MRTFYCAVTVALLSGCSVIPAGPGEKQDPMAQTGVKSIVGTGAIADASQGRKGSAAAEVLAKMPFNCPSGGFTYMPVPAFPAFGYTEVDFDAAGKATELHKKWPDEGERTNALLTEISLELSKLDRNASAEFGGMVSADATNSSYLLDFMKYRLEPISHSGAFVGWSKVGVGLRVVITFATEDAKAGGSFATLSARVKAGKDKGYMSINLVGVSSGQVTAAMPFKFGELTEAAMDRVLEGMTIMKTQLYEKGTRVTPRTLARLECTGTTLGRTPGAAPVSEISAPATPPASSSSGREKG